MHAALELEIVPEQSLGYVLVDGIESVRVARNEIRCEAETLLESRRQAYEQTGLLEYQPVDALSTARNVLATEQMYGAGSKEHTEAWNGLLLDCQRLVGEWYRKKKPEYFEPIRHKFDEESEEFFSHGLSIRQMTDNALTPLPDNPEDEARRINERVEEATPHLLRKLGHIAIGQQAIRTISECTDKAIADYSEDMRHGKTHRGYGGYVPEIEKVMIRDIRLDTASNDRFEEQIGLPGTYITHFIIQEALKRRGVAAHGMDKTTLHGTQLLVDDDLMAFAQLLDEVASEQWCVPIFMGEAVDETHPRNYDGFRDEARRRQDSLVELSQTTAQFVLEQAREGEDPVAAPVKIEAFVKKLLLTEALNNTKVAEQMFDTKTAVKLQQVAQLQDEGRQTEAYELFLTVEKEAPGGGYCGAGSCGLESVDVTSERGKGLLKSLKADGSETIVKDTERACRCGKKSIVYAYTSNKVTKYCESCGAFESKVSKVV